MNPLTTDSPPGLLHARGIVRKTSVPTKTLQNEPQTVHFKEDVETETPQMSSIFTDPTSPFYGKQDQAKRWFDTPEDVSDTAQNTAVQHNPIPVQRQEISQNSARFPAHTKSVQTPEYVQPKQQPEYIQVASSSMVEQPIASVRPTNPVHHTPHSPVRQPQTHNHVTVTPETVVEAPMNNPVQQMHAPAADPIQHIAPRHTTAAPQMEPSATDTPAQPAPTILRKQPVAQTDPAPTKPRLAPQTNATTGSLKAAGISKKTNTTVNVKKTPLLTRARNALIGMALAYFGRLEIISDPIVFTLKNAPTLILGFIHVMMPFAAAWFASNWNDYMQLQFWGGSTVVNIFSYLALSTVCAIGWSFIFLTLRGFFALTVSALNQFANQGESYIKQKE